MGMNKEEKERKRKEKQIPPQKHISNLPTVQLQYLSYKHLKFYVFKSEISIIYPPTLLLLSFLSWYLMELTHPATQAPTLKLLSLPS